jgi:glucose-6-phosphate isomerase
MTIDLSSTAGFPLTFDLDTLKIYSSKEIEFVRDFRTALQLKDVLFAPDAVEPDKILFYLDHLNQAASSTMSLLAQQGLTYGFTTLPAVKIGREFVKTHGHIHPQLPGSSLTNPEVYAQIYGTMWLFLEKHNPDDLSAVEDCVLYEMKPGSMITIPPGYAHMQINPGSEPSITAGLYGKLIKPEFDFFKKMKGFAYYILQTKSGVEFAPNMNYPTPPALKWIEQIQGTIFEPVDRQISLWQSFTQFPHKYQFLTDKAAMETRFFHQDHRSQ